MSRMSDVHIEIQDMIRAGKVSIPGIAKILDVPVEWVEMTYEEMMDQESMEISESESYQDNDSDAYADGEALASIGWGTDEDYGCYEGDY